MDKCKYKHLLYPNDPMPKKILSLSIAALLFFISGTHAAGGNYTPSPRNAEYIVKDEDLRLDLAFLTGPYCEGRGLGSKGSALVKTWLIQRFRETGLLKMDGCYARGFTAPSGKTGHNVIGFLPGSPGGGYVIVGAHFDHIGILEGVLYPGADSNASGVVAMLCIAKMVREMNRLGRTYGKNIIFVAFDGKGMSLSGSEAFWKIIEDGRLTDPVTGRTVTKDRISMMVNIDQVGGTDAPLTPGRSDFLIMLSDGSGMGKSNLAACNAQYGLGLQLGFDYYGSKDFTKLFFRKVSDQKWFVEHKVPSIMFTSGITMNNNKPADNLSSIDIGIFKKRIFLMYYWLVRSI